MTTTLEREEAPPVTDTSGTAARTIDLDQLAEAREARYLDRFERHAADASLDRRLREAYYSRDVWRIENLLELLQFSPNSRTKLSKMSGGERLLTGVDDDGTVGVEVLFTSGELPRADFVLNAHEEGITVITVKRIIPAWFKGTLLEALHKDHKIQFNYRTGLWTPNRQLRTGRPPGSRPTTTTD